MRYILVIFVFVFSSVFAENEQYYSSSICNSWGGKSKGIKLAAGIIPDCETPFSIIEFDWAKRPKVYECIGQALSYSYFTNKVPVCVMLARDDKELEYGKKFVPVIRRSGVIPVLIDIRLGIQKWRM